MSSTGKQRVYLVSKRFDVSKYDTPELRWSFYDSFTSSDQTQAAITQNSNSIVGGNLEKYLTLTKKFTKVPTLSDTIDALPSPYNELLALQADDGSFRCLTSVLKCLRLPKYIKLNRAESTKQAACAFAVACIRQRIDLFDSLQDSHDRAVVFVHNGLVNEARDLIIDYTLTSEEFEAEYGIPRHSTAIDMSGEGASAAASIASDPPADAFQREDSPPVVFSLSTKVIPQAPDPAKIAICSQRIHDQELSVIQLVLELDGLVDQTKDCLQRCIHMFLGTELLAEKNAAFDELTARLGEGFPPREGFTDWRREGVPGLRTKVVDILCQLQVLADLRLTQETNRKPSLSTSKFENIKLFSNQNRGRWALHYNGYDVVAKVLHCTDFLRNSREISGWYGRKYWFLGNPLALPFNMNYAFCALDMADKVREQISGGSIKSSMQQSDGLAEGQLDGEEDDMDWEVHQHLTKWGTSFDSLCSRHRQWNWPSTPETRRVDQAERLHTAMVVLFVSVAEDIASTVSRETEFINLVKAGRGEHLLIGKAGVKPSRQLSLPTDDIISQGTKAVLDGVVRIKKKKVAGKVMK